MELHIRICIVLLGTLMYSIPRFHECRKLEGYKFPVYSTEFCPRNETEWNKRSSALKCNETNGYTCLPNERFTELLEFCYTQPRIWIEAGTCLVLVKKVSLVHGYKCHGFFYGCPSSSYLSSSIFEYPTCIHLRDKCFFAEPTCKSKQTHLQDTTDVIFKKPDSKTTPNPQKTTTQTEAKNPRTNNYNSGIIIGAILGAIVIGLFTTVSICIIRTLKIWKNVPCTSSVNALTQRSSDIRRNEKDERTDDAETRPRFEATEVGCLQLIQIPQTPDGCSLNQGMSTSNTQEEIMSSNPETPELNKSPEVVSRSLTFASPNGNSSNQGITTPNTPKKMMSSAPETPVLNKSPEDVSRSLAFASPNENSSNQGITAPNTPESSGPETPVINTLVDDVPRQSPNENSSNQGITANTQEEILHLDSETTVLNTSPEVILRSLTAESRNKDSSNIGTSALDSLQPSVSVSQTTREDISRSVRRRRYDVELHEECGTGLFLRNHSINGSDLRHEEEECTPSIEKHKDKINQGMKAKHKN